ncbi:retinol dehydrogenase 14b isoform 2-T2 [Symphorus nematophorus]
MSTAVLVAAVVGGGVLLLMRRLFPQQKAVKLLRYTADTMRGKTVIVTGANCGIGKALAGELLKLRARVVMACRDLRSAEEAARDIQRQAGPEQGEVVIKHLDLSSLRSVRQFCEDIQKEESKIDILINNAGVYQCPYTKTEDGFEMQLGVNHLGHFLLTHLLLDLLKTLSPSRIVVVSSKLYKYGHINFDDLNSETGGHGGHGQRSHPRHRQDQTRQACSNPSPGKAAVLPRLASLLQESTGGGPDPPLSGLLSGGGGSVGQVLC